MKKHPTQTGRAAACYELLDLLSHRQLPVVCETQEDIHKILALRSASLLEAEADPIVLLQSGERRIERIVVTGITAEGRAACLAYNAMAVPAWRR
ncbi:hypothetical protein VAR608DRAFT_1585 [Variovorax sp. HW608]|uniref:hypothetical protein n=1 Tax=Variovorax sp. HW608 TaxID=1034889 RepID=UPI00081F8F5C|nr:hypothetical protein [Variovorax sp. HW608]SCK21090.1 hypothetical protein VAR608DRAFT_1585 [Variovorax sp. HW608]